jgi:D-alanyl-D-alanine carboxypeptidase/D-alanyl-D-alanine-endopeptidase (penicillin-binding protein 4)
MYPPPRSLLRRSLRLGSLAFVAFVLAAAPADSQPAYPAAPLPPTPNDHAPDIEAAILAITRESLFKDAAIGIAVLDIDTGHYLAVSHEHDPLNPASNAKLYTAACALANLHGDHRYETTLSGRIKGSVVAGPLILRGYGDPSLRAADLWELAQDLKGRGIRKIEGDLVVDQRFFDEQTTPPAFEQQPHEWASFRAPVSAVSVNENTLTMTVRPTSAGSPAVVTFDPPGYVDMDGTIQSVEGGGADTVGLALAGSDQRMTAHVSGSIALESKIARFTRRVEDPTLLAGYALKEILDEMKVEVTGEVKSSPREAAKNPPVLALHKSAPLASLLYELGKMSDNFYAETIFKTIGGERKARPARSADAAEVMTRWLGEIGAIEPGVVIKNGSGLFDANRVTAASTVQLLRAAWRDSAIREEYVAQLSIGGVDGTLRGRFKKETQRRAVRAKTGTLDDAIALGGYVLPPPGKGPLAFSILFNKVEGKAYGARAAADRLVELLAERLWGDGERSERGGSRGGGGSR